ncbi:MAG: hypothetical protein NUV65_00685 [Candidatus Roizmanbacteria bacterium]|nr:hypothetical protein [Candidatus Roizmanbacteria bacterium]
MKRFRFSPIKNKDQLFKAIEYIHLESHRLCKENLGYTLPVAGNIGFFCHYVPEFELLTGMRKKLTDSNDNWNQKYFRLREQITIPAQVDIPETIYTYLYIRKPDSNNELVGDIDFYMEPDKYRELKQSLLFGKVIEGVQIFDRPDLDLLKLSRTESDVVAFIGKKTMAENIRGKS